MTSGQIIPVALGSTNFASFGIDAVPVANTTKLFNEIPVLDPSASLQEQDDIEKTYDTVNQEPDLNTEEENNKRNLENFLKTIESANQLEKQEESSKTRSNVVREEQEIFDEYIERGEGR